MFDGFAAVGAKFELGHERFAACWTHAQLDGSFVYFLDFFSKVCDVVPDFLESFSERLDFFGFYSDVTHEVLDLG